jgi:hypothetical protein
MPSLSGVPFIVTDGRSIISKSRYEPAPLPFNIGLDKSDWNCSSTWAEETQSWVQKFTRCKAWSAWFSAK